MVSLLMHLEAGFEDDTVVVRVDGQEIFHKEEVTTDYSSGLAGPPFKIELPQGSVNIEINVPSQRQSDTIKVEVTTANIEIKVPSQRPSEFKREVSTTVYLGVSIVQGKLKDYRTSDSIEDFTYF